MTRDDVAHLVIRTFALWLGTTGLATLGSAPWMTPGPGGLGAIAMIAAVFIGVAGVVWLAAPVLTRAMFARPDRGVPFALTMAGVPALASFVTGLISLAGAVPQVISWIALQVMRRSDAGLVDSRLTDAFDQRSVSMGAEIAARIAVGVALLALSRHPNFWPIPGAAGEPPEAPPA